MNKPLVYLDQNVLGLQIDQSIDLSKIDNVDWAFSEVHFEEINRGDDAGKYLDCLDSLKAVMLKLELDRNWRLTGKAHVKYNKSAYQCYEKYMDAKSDVNVDGKDKYGTGRKLIPYIWA